MDTVIAEHQAQSTQTSSAFFKVRELFFEKLNIKIIPVPLAPYSKKPTIMGWTNDDYNPSIISWARHYGNVAILVGRSDLVVFDCDTHETVNFFENIAQEVDLPLDTLVVKTRRGRHYYYLCNFSAELERKKFSNDVVKLDIIGGNNYLVVAPFSTLKLNEKGEILDPRAENFILFEYTPIVIPEKLPEITREQYEKLIEKLEEAFKDNEEETIQGEPLNLGERELTDEEIQKLAEIIEPYFVKGQRQDLVLYLSGFLRKELKVSEESVIKFYEYLIPTDDNQDINARRKAIRNTFKKELHKIAGRKKLRKILGEKTAEELCKKINQALNIPDENEKIEPAHELIQKIQSQLQSFEETQYIFVEISRKNMKFARCNYLDYTIDYGVVKYDKDLGNYSFEIHTKVFDCCIKDIFVIQNILTNEKKYEIHFVSKNLEEPLTILQGTVREIWEDLLLKTSYVFVPSIAQQVLTIIVSYYLKQGWYKKKQEELPPGFYYLNDKLTASKFEEKEYSKEELKKAAVFLNEYIDSHPNPKLIASVVKAGLLLPFSFAQKQAVLAGKLRQKMKYMFLYGETKTGKTTTATLLQHIWGWDYKISYSSFNSEARAGKHLSMSTNILIVDEVSKDLEFNTVKEILKYSQEDLIARIIQSRTLRQIHYPALASIIMTSNSHFPEDPALLERFLVFKFRKSDKILSANRARYEKEDFRVLLPLGVFIWQYIKKHGLKDNYIDYATEILQAFYKEVGVEAEWLDWEFVHDTTETEEEHQYKKESEFYNAVIKFFNRNIKPKENLDFIKSIYYALKGLEFGRWIWIDNKDFIYISKDFLLELKKFNRCEIRDLEELAELTGWERIKKRFEFSKVWVVRTGVTDFFYRLNYIPQLLTTTEFKEWLMGRLEVKHPDEEA